jgi:galactokinase
LCLFGEHQDYLGLSVVATAIDLRFRALVRHLDAPYIRIAIRDARQGRLDEDPAQVRYEHLEIDLTQPIRYLGARDYLRSTIKVLQQSGYALCGLDIRLDSDIPIGKGMCSSSTMIVVLIKAVLEAIDHPHRDEPRAIAELAFQAEVTEFAEPGGRMDHYTSAIGGLVHLDFSGHFAIEPLAALPAGCFILFDSLTGKDTTRVLAEAKTPTLQALEALRPAGINDMGDFFEADGALCQARLASLAGLNETLRRKLRANIENHRILREGLAVLRTRPFDQHRFGQLLSAHHEHLRDGLGISTPVIESILATATAHGALGGKINGSGGGGCCFVYASADQADQIACAVRRRGYPARVLRPDSGVRRDA